MSTEEPETKRARYEDARTSLFDDEASDSEEEQVLQHSDEDEPSDDMFSASEEEEPIGDEVAAKQAYMESFDDLDAEEAELSARYDENRYIETRNEFSDTVKPLPQTTDPFMWRIKCRIDKEQELLIRFFNKFMYLKSIGKKCGIFSIVQGSKKGEIYFEAFEKGHVDRFTRGMQNVFFGAPATKLAREDQTFIVDIQKVKETHKAGSYVRIKRGTYKGDLGEILCVNKADIFVLLVPRINLTGEKRSRGDRIPQKVLDREALDRYHDISMNYKEHPVLNERMTYVKNEYLRVDSGLLVKKINVKSIIPNPTPTVDEIRALKGNVGKGQEEVNLRAILEQEIETADIPMNYATNDTVRVNKGELIGSLATVITLKNNMSPPHIQLKILEPEFIAGEIVDVPVLYVTKVFMESEKVRIVGGKHSGSTGMVMKLIDEDQATVLLDSHREYVKVFMKDLRKCSDSQRSADTLAGYSIYDLVSLGAGSYGVIVRIFGRKLEIIGKDGEVVIKNLTQLRGSENRRSKNQVVLDSKNHQIREGDSVRPLQPPNPRIVSATVKRIVQGTMFLYSRQHSKNCGIFTARPNQIVMAGVKSRTHKRDHASAETPYKTPVLQSPALSTRVRSTKGHNIIGQRVSVTSGRYKGYSGTVEYCDVSRVVIEVPSLGRQIDVETKDVKAIHTRSGREPSRLGSNSFFSGEATPMHRVMGGTATPMRLGMATPGGIATPMRSGMETPMAGINTPGATAWDPTSSTPGARTPYGTDYGADVASPYNPAYEEDYQYNDNQHSGEGLQLGGGAPVWFAKDIVVIAQNREAVTIQYDDDQGVLVRFLDNSDEEWFTEESVQPKPLSTDCSKEGMELLHFNPENGEQEEVKLEMFVEGEDTLIRSNNNADINMVDPLTLLIRYVDM
eukprot:TRINITY_DN97061_c0_g2_i1.p1 TRINITY_DN97061_c0_g2~~TRINITY_DN97061_c0_g2_i1.p1  ORF type:complete len:905 (+),score=337.78 TRINITY_DN97061_c0_g2_i1:155-2869(+)